LTAVKAKDVARGLRRKGFDEIDNGDLYYHFMVDGRKSGIFTLRSKSDDDLGARYLTNIARQVFLKRDELLDLVRCPLSWDDYIAILRERGRLWNAVRYHRDLRREGAHPAEGECVL